MAFTCKYLLRLNYERGFEGDVLGCGILIQKAINFNNYRSQDEDFLGCVFEAVAVQFKSPLRC